MCGMFYIEADDMTIEVVKVLESINREKLNKHASRDVKPTDYAPVITVQGVSAMQWGFTLPDRKIPIINARSETAAQKPLFAPSLQQRRCLLPASGYYEWDRSKNKYTIGRGSPIFIAGIYRPEDDRVTRICILTQSPTVSLSHIHDRMPVILHEEAAEKWLMGSLQPNNLHQYIPQGIVGHTHAAQISMFDGLT